MEKINKLRRKLKSYNLDGYLIPKNDEFFNEFIPENKDYLRDISNFSGSYGIALILKKNNYLFVDGRYTVQANIQSGKYFQVITLPFKKKKNNLNFKKKRIGFNPKLFNHRSLKHFSQNLGIKCVKINENLNKFVKQKRNYNIKNKFYVLDKAITGQSSLEKIRKLNSFFYKKKIDVMLITSSENIAWLLNIRGQDSDFSPLPNCFLIVDKLMRIYLFCDLKKIDAKFKKKLNYINILKIDEIENFLKKNK